MGNAWLKNSLKHKIKELRERSKLIRGSYKKEPMRGLCRELADVYSEAADVFQRALNDLVTFDGIEGD